MTPRFERFAAIDWSGAKGVRHKGIAVALCEERDAVPRLIAAPDGIWSRRLVADWLVAAAAQAPTLFGFDFSFAPPFITRRARPCTGTLSNGVLPAEAAMRVESTIQGASGSMKMRSAALPGAKLPASTPRIRAGLADSRVISRLIDTWPSRTRLSERASKVSAPAMPGAASAKGRRLSSGPRGSWPEVMTSIVPSATAAMLARRSASLRSGGDRRAKVRKSVAA